MGTMVRSVDNLAGLCYLEGEGWLELPRWANFLIALGFNAVLASREGNNPLRAAIVLPSRAYAAAFIAAGVVLAQSGDGGSNDDDKRKHFESIANMPIGTSLVFRDKKKKYKAVFEGVTEDYGALRLRVRIQNQATGGLTSAVPLDRAFDIALADSAVGPLPKNPSGRLVKTPTIFLEKWLGGVDSTHFVSRSTLDCLIIATRSQIEAETMNATFGARMSKGVVRGSLQDLLRIRSFLPPGEAYRCDVVPANRNEAPKDVQSPSFTVFDGARGFINQLSTWRDSHSIAVFDRTDPNLVRAADVVNQGYALRAEGEAPDLEPLTVPAGVELLAYWEVR